jgi:hypothetical protein
MKGGGKEGRREGGKEGRKEGRKNGKKMTRAFDLMEKPLIRLDGEGGWGRCRVKEASR